MSERERDITDLRTHPDRHVTVKQLAKYFCVSERTIYQHIEKGALDAVRVGDALRIPIEAARAYGNPRRPNEGVGRKVTP